MCRISQNTYRDTWPIDLSRWALHYNLEWYHAAGVINISNRINNQSNKHCCVTSLKGINNFSIFPKFIFLILYADIDLFTSLLHLCLNNNHLTVEMLGKPKVGLHIKPIYVLLPECALWGVFMGIFVCI